MTTTMATQKTPNPKDNLNNTPCLKTPIPAWHAPAIPLTLLQQAAMLMKVGPFTVSVSLGACRRMLHDVSGSTPDWAKRKFQDQCFRGSAVNGL